MTELLTLLLRGQPPFRGRVFFVTFICDLVILLTTQNPYRLINSLEYPPKDKEFFDQDENWFVLPESKV